MKDATLPGVKLLTWPFFFEDRRGSNVELWRDDLFREAKLLPEGISFVQDALSFSTKGVLRGIHGDDHTWKLITCVRGLIYFVVVDPVSKKWEAFDLSAENRRMVLVPPGFGNGHQVRSKKAIFAYKLSHYTDTAKQFSLRWDDPAFAIPWPIKTPILSDRDAVAATLPK